MILLSQLDNRIFGLDAQLLFQLIFQGIAVFIIFVFASKLLLDPVRKILNERKERVENDQKEAAENKEEAIRFKEEYDGKLKNIDKEAEQILSEARTKALNRENAIVNDAREEASRIIASARQEAELEKKRVKDEVKQEMISVASLMSEKIVAASIDADVTWDGKLHVNVTDVNVPIVAVDAATVNAYIQGPIESGMSYIEQYLEIHSFVIDEGVITLEATKK